jgi:hypothetical protein
MSRRWGSRGKTYRRRLRRRWKYQFNEAGDWWRPVPRDAVVKNLSLLRCAAVATALGGVMLPALGLGYLMIPWVRDHETWVHWGMAIALCWYVGGVGLAWGHLIRRRDLPENAKRQWRREFFVAGWAEVRYLWGAECSTDFRR